MVTQMHCDFETHKKNVQESVSFLESHLARQPEVICVLGTGLGELADHIEKEHIFPYDSIPHFPQSTVTSHTGNLIFGYLGGKYIAALQGRVHFYEGYSAREVAFPIRVLSLLGAEVLFVSNASGGLNSRFSPGTVMIIKDHLNFIPDNPLRGPNEETWGPRFPDCSRVYDPDLIQVALSAASELNLNNVVTGTYVAVPGPSLETPAETRFLRSCGADAVGMSTVPEVIMGVHAGLKVLGFSLVANVNDPDNQEPILLEDVLQQVEKSKDTFQQLVLTTLASI